jgi:hypothetical protein
MAARNEGTMSEAQAWEKMAEPPILMGVIGDSVSSPADTGQANEARPKSIGSPG